MITLAILAFHVGSWWLVPVAFGLLSLADVTTPLTTDDVRTSIYNVLAALGVNTTTWKPGAVTRTLITGFSILAASFSTLIALIAGGGFLETAFGDWLTLVARYVYGIDRELATFAPGEVTLTNAGGGVYTLDPDDLILSNPDTGKTYRNTTAFTLNALSTITIPIVAVESGSASNAVPHAITKLETTLLGVTASNAGALVGLDDETDPTLKTRCGESLGALSPNGPWDAYTYVARGAKRADGSPIGITRVVTRPDGYGNVFMYAATPSGGITGTVGDPTTDLGALALAIQRNAVPLAVTANPNTATPRSISPTYQLWIYNTTGRNEAEVLAAVSASLALYMAKQPIGGNVISGLGAIYIDAIERAIGSTFPEIFRVVVSGSDFILNPNEVPVLGAVTGTINFVSPPEGF